MAKRLKKSETALIEQWRIALKNAEAQSEIKTKIAQFDYDTAKLQEGQTI